MQTYWGDLKRIWPWLLASFVLAVAFEAHYGDGAGMGVLFVKEWIDSKHAASGPLRSVQRWVGTLVKVFSPFALGQWLALGALAWLVAPLVRSVLT